MAKVSVACKNCKDYHKNDGLCSGSDQPCESKHIKLVDGQLSLKEFYK